MHSTMGLMDELARLPIVKDENLESKLEKLTEIVKREKGKVFKKAKPKTNSQATGLIHASHGQRNGRTSSAQIKEEGDEGSVNGREGGLIGKRRHKFGDSGNTKGQPPPKRQNFSKPLDKNVKTEKTDWKQVKEENKMLREKRKQKKAAELYELSKEVKLMWEELRQDSCPKDKRKSLSYQVFKKIKPFLKKIIHAHDMVRVVECLLQHGEADLRNSIFEELKQEIVVFSKNKYAHFFVLKMLRYGSKEHRHFIMKSFEGQVNGMLKCPFSMEVVELAYNDYANAAERSSMVQELYGPEFKLFKDTSCKSLTEVLQKNPAKRDTILKNLKENLLKILPKGPWKMSMMHTLIYDFLSHCDEESRAEFIDLIKNDVVNIIHTRDGARVGMLCLWHGTAKDRKHIVKTFKTFVGKISKDEHGFMVMLALFDSVDDTTLVSKAIINELLENVGSAANEEIGDLLLDKHGRKVILYLIAHRKRAFFHPQVIEILQKGDGNKQSKKDHAVRERELFNFTVEKLVKKLNDYENEYLRSYLQNSSSLLVLLEILNSGAEEDMSCLLRKVAEVLCEEVTEATSKILTVCLKSLTANDNKRNGKVTFSQLLIDTLKDKPDVLSDWLNQDRICHIFAKIVSMGADPEEKLVELLQQYGKVILKNNSQGALMIHGCLKKDAKGLSSSTSVTQRKRKSKK